MLTDLGEGPALLVETTGFFEVLDDHATSAWSAGSFDVLHDRGPADLEVGSELVDLLASQVERDQLIDVIGLEPDLGLTLTLGLRLLSGSWCVEDPVQLLYLVFLIGITSQELHQL